MKIYSKKISKSKYDYLSKLLPPNNSKSLYIDIETTGFSRSNDMIYLVGLLYFENEELVITQYLCEKQVDEYELLYKLNSFIINFEVLIHFNGDSFDLPFIKERMKLYRIHENISDLASFDFLKKLRPFKKVLGTDNLKLKTMEKLAGYERLDPFSGGELIQLYNLYTKGDKKLELSFILHNEEDMIGLYYLNMFVPLIEAFGKSTLYTNNLVFDTFTNDEKELESDFLIQSPSYIKVTNPLAINYDYYKFRIERDSFVIVLDEKGFSVTFPKVNTTLKTYLDDYENYYYLPEEDKVVHVSIASFMQSKFKRKATKKTAYIKKQDIFISCPLSKKALLSIISPEINAYIFTFDISDTTIYFLENDFNTIIPYVFQTTLKELLT